MTQKWVETQLLRNTDLADIGNFTNLANVIKMPCPKVIPLSIKRLSVLQCTSTCIFINVDFLPGFGMRKFQKFSRRKMQQRKRERTSFKQLEALKLYIVWMKKISKIKTHFLKKCNFFSKLHQERSMLKPTSHTIFWHTILR